MGLGYPLLCVGHAVCFVRPSPGRRYADDRHHPSLRLDAGEPTTSTFPGQTSALRHDVCPGSGHPGPLPTRLPVVDRQLPSAHLQSRCRLVVLGQKLALRHFNMPCIKASNVALTRPFSFQCFFMTERSFWGLFSSQHYAFL